MNHLSTSPESLYHPDYLGSIEWVTNADGRPMEYFWYSPWGETLQADNSWRGRFSSPFKFTGHIEDEETGLTYAGARYYPARESQWLSVDPLAEHFPSWTPYHYVHNNPVNLVDPDGRGANDPKGLIDVEPPCPDNFGPDNKGFSFSNLFNKIGLALKSTWKGLVGDESKSVTDYERVEQESGSIPLVSERDGKRYTEVLRLDINDDDQVSVNYETYREGDHVQVSDRSGVLYESNGNESTRGRGGTTGPLNPEGKAIRVQITPPRGSRDGAYDATLNYSLNNVVYSRTKKPILFGLFNLTSYDRATGSKAQRIIQTQNPSSGTRFQQAWRRRNRN